MPFFGLGRMRRQGLWVPGLRASGLWRLPVGILLGAGAVWWLWHRGTINRAQLPGQLWPFLRWWTCWRRMAATTAQAGLQIFTPQHRWYRFYRHTPRNRIMPINRSGGCPGLRGHSATQSGTVYQLRDLQGYDSLLTRRYISWAGALDGGSPAPPENGNMVFTYGVGAEEAQAAGAAWIVSPQALEPRTAMQLAYRETMGLSTRTQRFFPRTGCGHSAAAPRDRQRADTACNYGR